MTSHYDVLFPFYLCLSKTKMSQAKRIAIIGAGIAGAACAEVLTEAGHQVSLFDKSRGAGGRMSTRRGDGWQCDHGAQYFRARDPLFRAAVEEWEAAGVVAPWAGRVVVVAPASTPSPDTNLARFVGTPTMTAPARFAARNASLLTSHTINSIAREGNHWVLICAETGTIATPFDTVVLATPAPQAAPLLSRVAPDLAALARQVEMLPCWALMLRYDAPLNLPFDGAFISDSPIAWVARDNSKPERPDGETWLIHASARWSEAHIESTPEAVIDMLQKAFMALGAPASLHASAHRWRYADVAPAQMPGHLWNSTVGLGVCGDWMNGGKVEGAWLSGHTLGKKILGT